MTGNGSTGYKVGTSEEGVSGEDSVTDDTRYHVETQNSMEP